MARIDLETAYPEDLTDRAHVVPLGAIEWHGSHLPLGTDSLIARAFCERLGDRLDAVVHPCLNVPMTTLPHASSLDFRPSLAVQIWERTVEWCFEVGATQVLLVSGHYAQAQRIELARLSNRFAEQGHCVHVGTPLEPLADEALLDHAGKWETSQIQAIDPGLFRGSDRYEAVLGDSPDEAVDPRSIQESALDGWIAWTERDPRPRNEAVLAAHQSYADRYGDDWDVAIRAWWKDRIT